MLQRKKAILLVNKEVVVSDMGFSSIASGTLNFELCPGFLSIFNWVLGWKIIFRVGQHFGLGVGFGKERRQRKNNVTIRYAAIVVHGLLKMLQLFSPFQDLQDSGPF